MRKRTKIKAALIALFFILIAVPLALSVTRTISDSHDDIATFIVNSKGNYWEANGSNIQAAINDLELKKPRFGGWGGVHGYVWLPTNTTLITNGTIVIEEHTTLDMEGSTIVPSGNFDVFELKIGAQLRNGIVNISSVTNYNSAVVTFEKVYFYHGDHLTKVYNMELISDGLRGKGIYLYTNGTSGSLYQQVTHGSFYNIKTRKFEYGITLNHTKRSDMSYLNGNIFKNIYGYGDKYFITLHEDDQCEVAGNYFQNVQCNCTSDTEYVIWNNGVGNVFDNVVAHNWDNNGGTRVAYNFSDIIDCDAPGSYDHYGADECYLSFRGGGDDIEVLPWERYGYNQNVYTFLNLETGNLTIGVVNEG